MILALIALSFLGLSPAAADDGGTCANCHTQPQKKQDDLKLQPFFGGPSKLSKSDEDALRAWLQAQDGQVEVAPQDATAVAPLSARPKSTPCIVNCHASNPSPAPTFSLAQAKFAPMDSEAIRAWMGYPSQPGNPATAAVSDPDPKQPDPKAVKQPDPRSVKQSDSRSAKQPDSKPAKQPDPQPQTQPDPQPQPQPDAAKDTAAKPQLEATAADGKGREHFDGANGDAQPVKGDVSVDAGPAASKASPVGQLVLKPKQPSAQVSDVPDPSAQPREPSRPASFDPLPPRDYSNAIGGAAFAGGCGVLIGLMFGGLPGGLIGGLAGAAVGGLLGLFL